MKRKSKPALPPKPTNISGGKKSEIHQPTKEEQQQELSTALEKLENQIQMRRVDLQTIEEEVSQMKETIKMKETALDAEGKELDRKEKLYSLLPDAPAHMDRMKKLLESNQQKMAILEQEWLEIKQPLEDEYQNWLSHHKNVIRTLKTSFSMKFFRFLKSPFRVWLSSWKEVSTNQFLPYGQQSKKSAPKRISLRHCKLGLMLCLYPLCRGKTIKNAFFMYHILLLLLLLERFTLSAY